MSADPELERVARALYVALDALVPDLLVMDITLAQISAVRAAIDAYDAWRARQPPADP